MHSFNKVILKGLQDRIDDTSVSQPYRLMHSFNMVILKGLQKFVFDVCICNIEGTTKVCF